MGIEPTEPGSRRIPTGFEVQASHQARFTSACPVILTETRSRPTANKQIYRHSSEFWIIIRFLRPAEKIGPGSASAVEAL
jgi:hypothetical protein